MDYVYRPSQSGNGTLKPMRDVRPLRGSNFSSPGKMRLTWQMPKYQIPTRLIVITFVSLLAIGSLVWGGTKAQQWIVARQQTKKANELAQQEADWQTTRDSIAGQVNSAQEAVGFGQQKQSEGDMKQAVAAYELAVQYEPNWRDALLCLGQAYLAIQEYDKAEVALGHALNLDPINPTTHNLLASLYQKTNRAEAANTELKKADQLATETGQQIGG